MTTQLKKLPKELQEQLPKDPRGKQVMLGTPFFKALSDTEFIIIWNTPDLQIILPPKAAKYVEKRRRELGLILTKKAGFNLETEAEIVEE